MLTNLIVAVWQEVDVGKQIKHFSKFIMSSPMNQCYCAFDFLLSSC